MNHVRPNGLTIRPSTCSCACRTCNQPCCDKLRAWRYAAISLSNAVDGGLSVKAARARGNGRDCAACRHRMGGNSHASRGNRRLARLSLGGNRFNRGAARICLGHTQHRSRNGQKISTADKLGLGLHATKNKPTQLNRSVKLCACSGGVLGPCSQKTGAPHTRIGGLLQRGCCCDSGPRIDRGQRFLRPDGNRSHQRRAGNGRRSSHERQSGAAIERPAVDRKPVHRR